DHKSATTSETVTVSNVPTSVRITAPTAGNTVSGVVPVAMQTAGTIDIVRVQLVVTDRVIDTMSPATSNTYNYDWDTSQLVSGSYTLQAKATDTTGAIATSQAVIVTVDGTPEPPANLVVSGVTDTTVSLTWQQTNPSSVAHYLVYRDNAVVAQPTTTTFTDSGLTPGTGYTYAVAAVGTDGETSAMTNAIPIHTNQTPDTQPPSVPQSVQANAPNGDQVNLRWNASTDNVAVAGYKILRDGKLLT